MSEDITKLPERIYYVSAPGDDTVLVALDVEIRDNVARWFDTVKERVMEIKETVNDNPKHFVFKRDITGGEGDFYTFIPMTLDIYNEKVKSRLLKPRDFKNINEMASEFEKAKKNVW